MEQISNNLPIGKNGRNSDMQNYSEIAINDQRDVKKGNGPSQSAMGKMEFQRLHNN